MAGTLYGVGIGPGDPELIKMAEDASGEKLDIPPPAPEPPAAEADGADGADAADGAAPSDADVLAGEGDAAPADGEPAPTPDAP